MVAAARLLSRAIVLFVFFIQSRAMAHGGETADFGRFTLLIFTASLTSFVVDIGLRPLFIREVAKDRALLTPYLNRILSLKLVMAVPAFAIVLVAIHLLMPGYEYAVFATVGLLLGANFSNQLRATFYAVGDLHHEFITTIAETVVLLGATVAVAVLRLDFSWFLWAYALSYGFTIVYASAVAVGSFGHRFRFDLDVARLVEMGRESLPFALTFVVGALYYRINGVFLRWLTPDRDPFGVVGQFGAAYKFLDAATFIPQALMDPVFPALSRLAGGGDRLAGATVKAYKMLAVAAVPVTLVLVLLAEPIVRYTTGPAYLGAVPILRVLGLSVIFLFVNNTFIYTLNAMGRQRESTRLAVQSLVLNVALNVVLIPQHSPLWGGAMGAAWATVLTELGLFAGGWWLLRRHLFALPVLRELRGVIPAGVLCGVVMGGMVLGLGPHLWVYALAVALGMAAYALGLLGTHAFTPDELALLRQTAGGLLRRRG